MKASPSPRRRRRFIFAAVAAIVAMSCLLPLLVLARSDRGWHSTGRLEHVWGRRGVTQGRMQKPRAMAIDDQDRLYIVDTTARIQVFDRDGQFLHGWQAPEFANGKPTGMSFSRDGLLMVADTHYFRVLFYKQDGILVEERTLGGEFGNVPGSFGLVTDVVEDSQGCLYVSEYGEYDRIQKFDPNGQFLFQWGGHGPEPGRFIRPQNMTVDEHDHIWVVDACNDRIQVFDATGSDAKLVRIWGQRGSKVGQLRYPYDLSLDGRGHIYICEFGNSRVQKFTLDGKSVGVWGKQGRSEGELFNPWALSQDSKRRLHVLDSNNHRVQRIRL